MDITINRKHGLPKVEIAGATDSFVSRDGGFYNVRRGADQWRYPTVDIEEVIEYGREDRV